MRSNEVEELSSVAWMSGAVLAVLTILVVSGCGDEKVNQPTFSNDHTVASPSSTPSPVIADVSDTPTPTTVTRAPDFSPYSVFQSLSLGELKTVQIKLTHVGPQLKPIATVAADTSANELDLTRFIEFRRPGFNYANDEGPISTFELEASSIDALIDGLTAFPPITAGQIDAIPRLSFTMVAKIASGEIGFEAIVNDADAKDVLNTLFSSLSPSNDAAIVELRELWTQLNYGVGPLNPSDDGNG